MTVPFSVRALHLTGLSLAALAQPMYALLAQYSEFFILRGSQPIDIFVLVILLSFVFPLPLVLLSSAAGFVGPRLGMAVQCTLVGWLVGVLLVPPLVRLGDIGAPLILIACLSAGVASAVLYGCIAPLRQLLSFICMGFLSFPLLFLLDPGMRRVAFPPVVSIAPPLEIQSHAPVVLLIFDELPTSSLLGPGNAIDRNMFPHFYELSRHAVWFRNATAVATDTHMAIPAILTGNEPVSSRHPTHREHPRNLFSLLESAYKIDVVEPYTSLHKKSRVNSPGIGQRLKSLFDDLCVVYLHIFLPVEWAGDLPPITQDWKNFSRKKGKRDKNKLKRATEEKQENRLLHINARELLQFNERMDATSRSLWFMHSMLPHAPHNIYPSGRYYTSESGQPSGEGFQAGAWSNDEWAISQAYQRHLLQVSLVDNLLGAVIKKLKKTGLWDTAIFIVTADHGISFRSNDSRRRITNTNAADILSIPLFVRAPGLEAGRVDDTLVRSTDIFPTIIDLLEIDTAWPMDGKSLFDPQIATRVNTVRIAGEEGRRYTKNAIEKGRQQAVSAKWSLFNSEYPGDLYRYGPFGYLIGRSLDTFERLTEGGLRARIDGEERFRNVSLSRREIPGQVVGRIELTPEQPVPWIAIGINGVMQAVTRPYMRYRDQGEVLWSAILPQASIINGNNEIELFTLDISPDDTVRLREMGKSSGLTSYLGVTLGAERIWGVDESGFHESVTGKSHRWTNGKATVAVPIEIDNAPNELEISLLGWGPDETDDLKVVANGMVLYAGPAVGKHWTRRLSLSAVEMTSKLEIEILSGTWGRNNDRGVLVQSIVLR